MPYLDFRNSIQFASGPPRVLPPLGVYLTTRVPWPCRLSAPVSGRFPIPTLKIVFTAVTPVFQNAVVHEPLLNIDLGRRQPPASYHPLPRLQSCPTSEDLVRRLVDSRTALRLSQEQAAKRMGVDASTLARWERSEREPTGSFLIRATKFVSLVEPVHLELLPKIA